MVQSTLLQLNWFKRNILLWQRLFVQREYRTSTVINNKVFEMTVIILKWENSTNNVKLSFAEIITP